MRLRFLPNADKTIGPNALFEFDGFSFLINCGLYPSAQQSTWDPKKIHATLLTRATPCSAGHLPRLIQQGFAGSVYATPPTTDQCGALFRDLAQPPAGKGHETSLYTTEEAEIALSHITSINFHRPFHLLRDLRCAFYQAGGVLGAALAVLDAQTPEGEKRIVFANQLGCLDHPILHSPELTPNVNMLVLNAGELPAVTPYSAEAEESLVAILRHTIERGGKILIPGDVLGNALPVIMAIKRHRDEPLFARLSIRSDSNFTENAAEALRRHHGMITSEARAHLLAEEDPFGFGCIQYLRGKHHHKHVLDHHGPTLLIAPFEDSDRGPVVWHLAEFLEDQRNLLLFTTNAPNTASGKLLAGQKEIVVAGQTVHVAAEVAPLQPQSASADQILNYITLMHSSSPGLEGIFLITDSEESGTLLSAAIEQEIGIKPYIPDGEMEYEW